MRRRSELLTHVVQTPYFPFNRVSCKWRSGPPRGSLSEPSTDYSPARSGGLLSAPPCSPSPAPPKSAPGGCLSESITDCGPARSGGLLSAPPCSPSPVPPKSAPGGCLSESITDYNLTLFNNHSLPDPPCSPALAYYGRYETAAR